MDNVLQKMIYSQNKLQEFDEQVRLTVEFIDREYNLLSNEEKAMLTNLPVQKNSLALTSYVNVTSTQLNDHLSRHIRLLKLFLYDS